MAEHVSRRRPARRTGAPAAAGTPSTRAAERLESQFAAELGLTRAAWDDALRRSDERWRQEDAAGLVECLEDQRRLLRLLEDRLSTVVSAAAVEREAEQIVGTVAGESTTAVLPPSADEPSRPGVLAAGDPAGPATHPRSLVQALAGAGAAVAVTMIAVALGATLGLGSPPVPEVAAPVEATTSGPEAARDGDFDHVVAIANHYAVSSVDLSAASTNWLQVLRALDLGTIEIDPPAEDPAPPREAADPEPQRPDEREASSAAPAGPERGAEESATSGRDDDPADDRDAGEGDTDGSDADDPDADESKVTGLLDLGGLGQDEETSLPGVEVPLP